MSVQVAKINSNGGEYREVLLRVSTEAEVKALVAKFGTVEKLSVTHHPGERVIQGIRFARRLLGAGHSSLAMTIPKDIANRMGLHRGSVMVVGLEGTQIVMEKGYDSQTRPSRAHAAPTGRELSFDAPIREPP